MRKDKRNLIESSLTLGKHTLTKGGSMVVDPQKFKAAFWPKSPYPGNHERLLPVGLPYAGLLEMNVVRKVRDLVFQGSEDSDIILQSLGSAFLRTNMLGEIDSCNGNVQRILGWRLEELMGKRIDEVFQLGRIDNRIPGEHPVNLVLKGGHRLMMLPKKTLIIGKEGKEVLVEGFIRPLHGPSSEIQGALVVFREYLDWGYSKPSVVELQQLDPILSKEEFERRAMLLTPSDSMRQAPKGVFLLYLRVEFAELIKSTFDSGGMEKLIQQAAHWCKKRLGQDELLGRMENESFAILLKNYDAERAEKFARCLIEDFQRFSFDYDGRAFRLGLNIGVSGEENLPLGIKEFIHTAATACFVSRMKGRNQVWCYKANDSEIDKIKKDADGVLAINRALAENAFVLYYQSIVPIQTELTQEGMRCEVLVRMLDEQGQIMLPKDFIPCAERYNLMPEIDRWVIRHLFAQLHQKRKENLPYSMYAVNLSGMSLTDETFLNFVIEQFHQYAISPEMICFEITETAAILNLERACQFVMTLRSMGCRFALDDFGSGQSSFTYLKNLPVDYVKIDGAFIKDILSSRVDSAMVEAVHRVGQTLGIQTVAEYVENKEILNKLKEMGIHYAQGFGIHVPEKLFV